MGLSRSTYYDVPSSPIDDAALVTTMIAICDVFEAYGYRRVGNCIMSSQPAMLLPSILCLHTGLHRNGCGWC
jgi:hypothetical protein